MRLWLVLTIIAQLVALVFAAGGSVTQCTASKTITIPSFNGKVRSSRSILLALGIVGVLSHHSPLYEAFPRYRVMICAF